MNKIAKRAWFTVALAGLLVVGMLGVLLNYFTQANNWIDFLTSPYIYRGESTVLKSVIVDRTGERLLSTAGGREYAADADVRRSMLHLLGDSKGYITPFLMDEYGDAMLGHSLVSGTYHSDADTGGRMQLTISAEVQEAALDALGSYKGTIGVYNYETGEVLCMVSAPNYDPTDMPDVYADEDAYEAVFVNRFLHATYAPGSIFKLVTAAAALEELDDIMAHTFYCEGSKTIAGETVVCNSTHGSITFEQALSKSCNVAFAELALELGDETLMDYARRFGITGSLAFDGMSTKRGNFDLSDAGRYETAWAAIGQYTDLINPCQFMTFVGAIANGGEAALPYVVEDVTYNGDVQYAVKNDTTGKIMSTDAADELADMMNYAVVNNYGEWNFAGLYAGGKSGTAQRGADEASNALFAGFVQDKEYPLAFVVVIEGGGAGSTACLPVISQVLTACVVALDSE